MTSFICDFSFIPSDFFVVFDGSIYSVYGLLVLPADSAPSFSSCNLAVLNSCLGHSVVLEKVVVFTDFLSLRDYFVSK